MSESLQIIEMSAASGTATVLKPTTACKSTECAECGKTGQLYRYGWLYCERQFVHFAPGCYCSALCGELAQREEVAA